MRLDRILALLLIVICLAAALGNWVNGRPTPEIAMTRATGGQAEVALIPIRGVIISEAGGPFDSTTPSAEDVIKALRRARQDQAKAILLRINSPGGTAAASQEIYDELMRIREETEIPIVASLGDVATSGGYYVASAANYIIANPATITGSIGVIIRSNKIFELLDNIGVRTVVVKSGEYKDILSPFRATTDEERAILQSIVQESYQQFLNAIVAARDISLEELRPIADGRIFTGTQAQAEGLVDALGNYSDALNKVAELASIDGEPTVQNYLTPGFPESLRLLFSASVEQLIPGYQAVKLALWNKIPLTLME